MKQLSISLLFLSLPLVSFCQNKLQDKPMPLLQAKTLDGKTIDDNYYKGHVTVVSFMFVGCRGCMNEISVLNQLHDEYKNNEKVQILCVASQLRDQMVQFNEDTTAMFGIVRKAFHVDPIRYSIQPACNDVPGKTAVDNSPHPQYISLKGECNVIEDVYGFNSFPKIFYVDKRGIISKIKDGGPKEQNDQYFHDEIKSEIEKLLKE